MKTVHLKWWLPLILLMAVIPVCECPAADESLLNVYVVNYPLQYFAERIGGPHVKVSLPVPQDTDPAYWVPGIAQISAYQQADLILLNGAGYAKWVTKVSLPRSKTVDTSRAFKDRYITIKDVVTHSHGPEGEHAHEGLAFTTWLDPVLATLQAQAVLKALVRKRPDLKPTFQARFESLATELQQLDDRLKAIVSEQPDTPLLFSHPVYDYLIRRYGINARSVHWEPDAAPSKQNLSELKKILSSHPARWMLWEASPVKPAAESLDIMKIRSAVFNPCAHRPPAGDFMSVMEQNAANLEAVYQ